MGFNSLNKFNIYNTTDKNISYEIKQMKIYLKRCLKMEKVKNAVFSVVIVDNNEIRKLNKEYRSIDKETDVISFALEDDKSEVISSEKRILGDIYISVDKAITQANEYGHTLRRELSFLAVHGLLHLLGYDHMNKEDEKIMFEKQELVLDGNKR